MSNKKQTAVEWFIELFKDEPRFLNEFALEIEQAKEMEKQQIIDAWKSGDITGRIGILKTKDEYYNENYEI